MSNTISSLSMTFVLLPAQYNGSVPLRQPSSTSSGTSFQVWANVSLDFIEALPKVHVKNVILTVV